MTKSLDDLKPQIIKEINIRLSNIFNNDFSELKQIMNDSNIYLSGLFLLECILEENFPVREIDFFISNDNFDKIYEYINNHGFKVKRSSIYSEIGSIGTSVRICIPKDESIIHPQNNYQINILTIKKLSVSMEKWLDDNMDFDILKNFYKLNSSEQIYAKCFDQIIDKTTIFQFSKNMGYTTCKYTIEKYIKLMNLGFIFKNNGNSMYNYIINNAYFTNKDIPHKVYYDFGLKYFDETEYIDSKGKKRIKYIFDLVEGEMQDLENNLFTWYGGEVNTKIIRQKNEDIEIIDNKVVITDRRYNYKCISEKKKIGLHNYCSINVCGLAKPHFHSLGTNIICCCVRTLLTFFVVDENNICH